MKMKVIGVARSIEDSTKPFALKIQFPIGVLTQPCTTEEFLRVLNKIFEDHEIRVEIEVEK